METMNDSRTYQQRLNSVRKYVTSQGLALDSPRARKYAQSQGVNPTDLGAGLLESSTTGAPDTARNYARSLGLESNDPSVRRYLTAGSENEPIEDVPIDSEVNDERFKETVLHYAQSQNLDPDDARVIKYARGLLKPTGDFSTEKHAERVDRNVIEKRIRDSVERYAHSMGLPLNSDQVRKYEDGQRRGPYRALLEASLAT